MTSAYGPLETPRLELLERRGFVGERVVPPGGQRPAYQFEARGLNGSLIELLQLHTDGTASATSGWRIYGPERDPIIAGLLAVRGIAVGGQEPLSSFTAGTIAAVPPGWRSTVGRSDKDYYDLRWWLPSGSFVAFVFEDTNVASCVLVYADL